MKLGNFLTAMFVVYLLSIPFGCWLNLKESRKEQLYWMKRTEQEMIEHRLYLEYIGHADSVVSGRKEAGEQILEEVEK